MMGKCGATSSDIGHYWNLLKVTVVAMAAIVSVVIVSIPQECLYTLIIT